MSILPITNLIRRKLLYLLLFCWIFTLLSARVVPHPMYVNPPEIRPSSPSELFGPRPADKNRPLPQNVLVLRVQFTDVTFQTVAAYPDNIPHNRAYFERWMLHLQDFFAAASRNEYIFEYEVPDMVFNLSNTMGYYGNDTSTQYDEKVPEMLQELIQMADPYIDYSQYDAIIVFHAGPGQESDINSNRPGQIWSTFMTRKDFQRAFDPENDNYSGLATDDGVFIKEIVLIPESEFQDYFPVPPDPNAYIYLFSIYGVLCHQFGHQIGLPTLFDNFSANGRSQGIGNWGLMGTGLWNGNGNVPAQLSAWSRYYLGWESAYTVYDDTENLVVDHFLDNSPSANRLYKVPISEKEYFLIENRQQNPDGSLDPYTNQPSFTFTLLDPSEQEYYPPPDSLRPYFNFMKNRYKGCEWDFFLPGLGGPLRPGEFAPTDGSGLLIWHIDENIIEANFDPYFEKNRVNGDASHKGVDVEEADGIQHLDTAVFDYYKYGGPFDTFRQGNNTYFGDNALNGVLHLPTAESYYGGIPLEIYNISSSANQMTFSVSFGWKLDTGYSGINTLDACSIDFDGDGSNEIFYPMPNGDLFLWKNEELVTGFPISANGEVKSYVWDGESVYLAYEEYVNPEFTRLRLRKLQNSQLSAILTTNVNTSWAAPLMSYGDSIVLPIWVEYAIDSGWRILVCSKDSITYNSDAWHSETDSLVANLAYYRSNIYSMTKVKTDGTYLLNVMTPGNWMEYSSYPLSIPSDSVIVAMSIAPIFPDSNGEIIIQTPYSVYITDLSGQIRNGYPIILPFISNTQVTVTDTDRNGSLDYIVSGENSFAVYDYAGKNMLTNFNGFTQADTLGITSGVLAGDIDEDGRTEYLGGFSRNRLAVFEENLRLKSGFPVSFSDRSRNLPFIHRASDNNVYAWLPTDNGKIFRAKLPDAAMNGLDNSWYCRYANLQRTSSREAADLPNDYQTNSLFVPHETYVFPNPVKNIYERKLTFHIMTSRDALVEVSVFDITGKILYRKNVNCMAYLKNRELVDFAVDRLTSGVYIAVLKSGDDIKRIKFAVEK